jgi:diguanylate cyclase (GGDEF)-like protein
MRRLRTTLAMIIVTAALVPAGTLSYYLLDNVFEIGTERVRQQINSDLNSAVREIRAQFEIFTTSLLLFTDDRFLVPSLDSFLLRGNALTSMRRFVDGTPLVQSLYLLDADLQVAEHADGAVTALHESELISALRTAVAAGELREDELWIQPFRDPRLVMATDTGFSGNLQHAIAVATPLFPLGLREPGRSRPIGLLLAIVPLVSAYPLLTEIAGVQEDFVLRHGSDVLVATAEGLEFDDGPRSIHAERVLTLGEQADGTPLEYTLEWHPDPASRLDDLVALRESLVPRIGLVLVLCLLPMLLFLQHMRRPFRKLATVLQQFQSGDYRRSELDFEYEEFAEVSQLLSSMGQKISQQIGSLRDLNQQLEQRVEEQTRELRETLETLRQDSRAFQGMVMLGIELHEYRAYDTLVDSGIRQLQALFGDLRLAVILRQTPWHRGHARALGIGDEVLAELAAQSCEPVLDATTRQLSHGGRDYRLLPLLGEGQELCGHVLIDDADAEGRVFTTLQLFARLLGAAIENRHLSDELERQARSDELTGFGNRKAFDEALEMAQHDFQRYPDSGFGLLVVDANGLKRINDRHGHAAGDALICRVAEVLGQCCRRTDRLFRIGGDEFVVLALRSDRASCEQLCDRLQEHQSGARLCLSTASGPVDEPVSFSIGCAATDEVDVEALFRTADERMYQQKQAHYRSDRE